MTWRAQIDDRGAVTRYKDADSGEVISAKEYERRLQTEQHHQYLSPDGSHPQLVATPGSAYAPQAAPANSMPAGGSPVPATSSSAAQQMAAPPVVNTQNSSNNPLIQPGAQLLNTGGAPANIQSATAPAQAPEASGIKGKNLRMEGIPHHTNTQSHGYKAHGFLDATSIAILLPTLVLLALIIAAAHKKRLFPWQTIRTFNPPSGLMSPREYERSYLCPPNLRRHGRLGKRNPKAAWTEQDGIVVPFGFLARTHLPVTIPLGRLPNKNMFIVAPSGSGKTTLMRAVIKSMLAKPCVIIALEAKANDPNLDERREGFKYTVLPEAQQAGFNTMYFNPLDADSIHWNPLDLDPITFASSIVQDVNSLPPEEQHWAERDHGYIAGLAYLLKWGAVMVAGEDENGVAADVQPLPCSPRGLMRLVNNRRNIVETLRRLKSNPDVDGAELAELTQTLSSIIRTDTEWDKNIQGIRGRLRMFKNPNILRVTEQSSIDMRAAMHQPTVLIFGAPASLGPDAESLASCFVYQLQQALHTRYGTNSVLPLFAFFDEYQTLNLDIAGRLSAIVRGANGGLTVILQNISQIAGRLSMDPTSSGGSELKTIFSNSAIRVCLHNADESTARFFSDEIGKHAIIVPGISDHYQGTGFGIFPSSWNRIHSQQVVPRIDTDSIKRMEKHHALVYLSPAGDNEFGETKPFMCDLRGIEEIARLHLLHNVSRPTTPTDPLPEPQAEFSPGPMMADADIMAAVMAAPAAIETLAAATSSARNCPHCGQAAGKGRFCIECGRPMPEMVAEVLPQPEEVPLVEELHEPPQEPMEDGVFEAVPVSLPSGVADVSASIRAHSEAASIAHSDITPAVAFAQAMQLGTSAPMRELEPLPVSKADKDMVVEAESWTTTQVKQSLDVQAFESPAPQVVPVEVPAPTAINSPSFEAQANWPSPPASLQEPAFLEAPVHDDIPVVSVASQPVVAAAPPPPPPPPPAPMPRPQVLPVVSAGQKAALSQPAKSADPTPKLVENAARIPANPWIDGAIYGAAAAAPVPTPAPAAPVAPAPLADAAASGFNKPPTTPARRPVTSLVPDPSKFPANIRPSVARPGSSAPKPPAGSVEF